MLTFMLTFQDDVLLYYVHKIKVKSDTRLTGHRVVPFKILVYILQIINYV